MSLFDRRHFMQGSAAFGSSLLASSISRPARAAANRVDAPIVDRVVVREITDNQHDVFLKAMEAPGLIVQRTGFPGAPQGKTLESEWGLALHIESTKGGETRRY